ncbi:MAG: CAP domain-containing protein [Erysipelothrix sp.]|nr:CAP domain-containing protein [Erysipelothrix sp.]
MRVKEIVESFSHTRPSGSKWYTVSNLVYAENLTVGYTSAQQVVNAWLASSGHKANIMYGYDTMSI